MTAPRNVVLRGDCLEVMRGLPADSVDAVVTDPPYELGFMGKSWDSAGVSFSPATWAEALRVLKPGGHLLAFGGSRTYHRIAVAIEDAGFEIRDSLMWIYGSGFPKSLDVSKSIDKRAGAEREVTGLHKRQNRRKNGPGFHNLRGIVDVVPEALTVTAPATEEAKRWEGWGTALKPAHEPIVLARKPLIGTVAENVLAHGTGALNIDASRIAYAGLNDGGDWDRLAGHQSAKTIRKNLAGGDRELLAGRVDNGKSLAGRWPANTLWDEEAAAQLDASTPAQPSRFFYVAKPTKRERNAGATNTHPTVKPVDLMRYLIKLVTPPGGVVLDPFLGSGSTACAAALEGFDYIGIEQNPEYADIAEARIAHWKKEAK